MTEYSTRRRTSNSNSRVAESENVALPSRIPVKSPARSVGGMAMAYSPIRSSPVEKTLNTLNTATSTATGNASTSSDYSKKLLELKNAMNLLKTPPAPAPYEAQNSHSQSHLVSYTPIKSSSLAKLGNSISPFASSLESIEISMEESSSSDTETTTPLANASNNNDNSLIDAYNDDEDSILTHRSSNTHNGNVFSSPTPSRYSKNPRNPPSSPYISSDELKSRIEATREAFQRSLEAQKRRLRTSIAFQDIDSSFSTCGSGFDSDLSVDSLRDTKNQLERIKREVTELIESDLGDVESIRSKTRAEKNLIAVPNESWTINFFKFLSIFTITSIIFTFLFINYAPNLSSLADFAASFDKQPLLERLEETLNFLLQD